MEDRVPKLLEKLLEKPSLSNPPPLEEGGLLLVSSSAGFTFYSHELNAVFDATPTFLTDFLYGDVFSILDC